MNSAVRPCVTQLMRARGKVVNLTIDSVTRISVSAIEEYEEDEEDEEEEGYYRTITIETVSGQTIEIDLNAASEDDLEVIEDE